MRVHPPDVMVPLLPQIIRDVRAHRRRGVNLSWQNAWGGKWCADFHGDRLWIRRAEDGEGSKLWYHWPDGARCLARGGEEELKVRAREILAAGGPHGGPAYELVGTGKIPTHCFTVHRLGHGIGVAGFGAGFQSWLRPFTMRSVCSTLVGPRGDFVVHGFDLWFNASIRALHCARHVDPWGETIPSSLKPCHIKIGGVTHRLVHTPVCGALGVVDVGEDEILLTITGPHELTLWRVSVDGVATELVRGEPMAVNGYEMEPHDPPIRGHEVPDARSVDAIAGSIEEMSSIVAPLRRYLVAQVREVQKNPGARTFRAILWALCAGHEAGRRGMGRGRSEELLRELHQAGLLAEVPAERGRRDGLALLERRVKIMHCPKPRSPTWIIEYGWLSSPPVELLAEFGVSD
jgi:hypothetical protein